MSNTQSARISASAGGASGKAAERQGGGLCGRRNRIALPGTSLQAGREAVRVHEPDPAAPPRREPGLGRGWAAGRRASRQSDKRFAAGPSASPTAKRRSRSAASSALRRRILAEAAALCSARRARSAPAAGGSARRQASSKASPAPAKNSGSPCPALPLARAQAGTGAAAETERAVGSRRSRISAPALRAGGRAQERPRRGRRRGRERGSRLARITGAWMNRWRRFVTLL